MVHEPAGGRQASSIRSSDEERSMTASPLPAGPFSVRAELPEAISSIDQVMIEVDGFRFGTAKDTDGTEWESALPFSEILELRFSSSGGLVSGTLRDGAELNFRFDQGHVDERAMAAVEDLIDGESGSSSEHSSSSDPDEGWVMETLLGFDDVFELAAKRGVSQQVRRFVYLVTAAGLEVGRQELKNSLIVLERDTDRPVLYMWWYSRSRCNFMVDQGLSELYGAEGVDDLPKAKTLHKMDVVETDLYLDGLEALFDVRPFEEIRDHGTHSGVIDPSPSHGDASSVAERGGDIDDREVPTPKPGFLRSSPSDPILSTEELADALGALTPAFEDAAVCGVEPQARRFAELTVAADLEVRWTAELRALTASWRRTGQVLFLMRWNSDGQVTIRRGFEEQEARNGYARVDLVEKAFGLRYTKEAGTLPEMDYAPALSTEEINRHTDSFLDWLETFLATHTVPSRQADAKAESEVANSGDATMAVLYSVMSFLWIGLIWYSIVLTPGGLGSTLGAVRAEAALLGVFYLVVPVGVLIRSLKVRRAIRRSGSDRGIESARAAIILSLLAIVLAVVLTVAELIRST